MEQAPYVQLTDICKSFGSVQASDHVSLAVHKGEIHALLGENGSGKSTLVNMLSGIYAPDSGAILIGGKEQQFALPRDAIAAGVGMVHQHFKLVELLSAKENIILGQKGGLFLDGKGLTQSIAKLAEKYGLQIDPDKKVYDMSVGEKQTVEILKMLYRGANILILDEPTAVLTPQEIKSLFDILRNMKREDCAVIIITHKLGEVMEISDRVTVLRKGQVIGSLVTSETSPQELTEMMVGHEISLEIERAFVPEEEKRLLLDVKKLRAVGPDRVPALRDLSFTVHSGEILGVAGIAGSGQKELCEIIAGLQKSKGGEVIFKGENILGLSPGEIIERGVQMSFVPEDRLGMGLVGGLDIVENVMLKTFRRGNSFFVDRNAAKRDAQRIVERFGIDTPSVNHIVKKLSGGNIQKVLLGREIDMAPSLLITAYPVRGLDIGASFNIYDTLNDQKKSGVGILFIGEDLDVLMQISDRLMVLHAGQNMGIVDPRTVSKEDIGLMMLGERRGEECA